MKQEAIPLDVAVIGGGPAGISTCIELSKKTPGLKMALFESEKELGGIPRTGHIFFGMRDLGRLYTGVSYARRLDSLVRKTPVEIRTETTVFEIVPGEGKGGHSFHVVSPDGVRMYTSQFLVLATGCCEAPLAARLIPSARPAGIFTGWQLQQMVRLFHLTPGKRAVVIGSEDAAFSALMSLRNAGVSVAGIVEEDAEYQTYPFLARAMSRYYGVPIYLGTSVKSILGIDRVEGIELAGRSDEKTTHVECDTVIVTGKFRPISNLLDNTLIARDPATSGPVVDTDLMTSVSNVFCAGNLLRGGDMHDLCALEGRLVAHSILKRIAGRIEGDRWVSLRPTLPIRFVVPQKIASFRIESRIFPFLSPGVAIQLDATIREASLEAWSGNRKIWEKLYPRLIANHRIVIPVKQFHWEGVNIEEGIDLRLKPPKSMP
jgi:thioredoxin reductase